MNGNPGVDLRDANDFMRFIAPKANQGHGLACLFQSFPEPSVLEPASIPGDRPTLHTLVFFIEPKGKEI